mmetsp:Transcript_30929/g.98706  ORF Transcript_30929/g.98706 Transcript_30929/m.98706 type:complete len:236 (-) Transcript_30929:14-721(-)
MPTPPETGSTVRPCSPSGSAGQPKSALTATTSPMAPASSSSRALTTAGKKRVHMPSSRKRPRDLAKATSSAASSPFIASGFSTSTGLPAASAIRAQSACVWATVPTYTTSTSGSFASASYPACALGTPSDVAKACAASSDRAPTAMTFASSAGSAFSAPTKSDEMRPEPMMPQRMGRPAAHAASSLLAATRRSESNIHTHTHVCDQDYSRARRRGVSTRSVSPCLSYSGTHGCLL